MAVAIDRIDLARGAINTFPLSKDEVAERVQEPSIDSCLQIAQKGTNWVGSRERVINLISRKPWQLLQPIEEAVTALAVVHNNPELNKRLLKDSLENPVAGKLYLDLARDAAHMTRAAIPLYRFERKNHFFSTKARINFGVTARRLSNQEEALENNARASAGLIDWELINADNADCKRWVDIAYKELDSLGEKFGKDYPDIVARAAITAIAWGSIRGDEKLHNMAGFILRSLPNIDPYVSRSMLADEMRSIKNRDIRSRSSFLTIPLASLNPDFNTRKQSLYKVLDRL